MSQKNIGKETLTTWFDIQRFITNQRIQLMVEAVGEKYNINKGCLELSDDELEVWAAGDLNIGYKAYKPEDEHE